MTTGYWLKTATQFLQSKAIDTARLDSLVLLEDTTHIDRAKLLAEPTTKLSDAQVQHLQNLLVRRSKHEPLAYIRGRSEFYGRNFVISPAVLVPRPESEAMIELLKAQWPAIQHAHKLTQNTKNTPLELQKVSVADVGTGSGALGITAALELKTARLELLDIDAQAIKIAKTNVDLFTLNLPVLQSNLLANTTTKYTVLLCNLPYVPDDYPINTAASYEPKIALFAGQDGLDMYRKLFTQLKSAPYKPLFIFIEAFFEQNHALTNIAQAACYKLDESNDFIQLFRYA